MKERHERMSWRRLAEKGKKKSMDFLHKKAIMEPSDDF